MSGYQELRDLGVLFYPFDGAPPPAGGRSAQFSASWGDTVALLARELRHLKAEQIVVELGLRDRDLRVDGLPRADARLEHDGVRINFVSKWGPLVYETAEYDGVPYRRIPGWQCNVRAIALSMEALRAVDRHGVSKRGEQYRGWRQIAAKSAEPADAIVDTLTARAFLDQHGGTFKAAAAKLHPDRGGDDALFRAAVKARDLIGAGA